MISNYFKKIRDNILYNRALVGMLFVLPVLVFFVLFIGYPLLNNLWLSFHDVDFYTGTQQFIGIKNYIDVFNDVYFLRDLKNTLIWTFGSVIGQVVLGLFAALLINRKFKGRFIVRNFLLIPYIVPVISLALVWRWLLNAEYGILTYFLQLINVVPHAQSPLAFSSGAMCSVIMAEIWRGFPFVMIIYWAALQSIDVQEYEAGRVDGAGSLAQFIYITLPHLKQVTLVLFIIRTAWTSTYFDMIYLITGGGPAGATEHFPIWLYQVSLGTFRFGYGATIAIIMSIGLFAVIFFYMSLFKTGKNAL